jgi:hypothetical protein
MAKQKRYFNYLILLLFVIIASCSGNSTTSPAGGNSSTTSSTGGTGMLGISLTDAYISSFASVNVTVSKVRVHKSASASESDPGWSEIILSPARKINLLDLSNGRLEELGQTPLPAGHYTQLRLVLLPNTGQSVANSVVLSGTTTEIPLKTPSAAQSGIKLINEFDVASGQRVDLVLDFDALKSVVRRGNGSYGLKPVISVIPTALNGIDGFVNPALLDSNVMVSAQVNGVIVRSGAPNSQTGEFFLARLAPGSYDVVITADGLATTVIAGVPISGPDSSAIVSTSAAPINLPASSTRTIGGTITLDPPDETVVAYVSSRQTFTGGPTVTVQSQATEGAYSFVLPTGAPRLGQYGTGTLPIALTDQPEIAGIYAVEASASGYLTQSVTINISSANPTQNFTLTKSSGISGIDGFVDPTLLGSNVMVSAQENGTIVRSSAPDAQTGEFLLAPLAPGNYEVVITADGRATAVISGVPISGTNSTAIVSTSMEPINLPISIIDIGDPPTRIISGTVTLNPPNASVVARVAAKQVFPSGPTVTVQSQAVDNINRYSMNLPIGAPLLGEYGTGTLPIIFTNEIVVEGIYTVEASATGYLTQSVSGVDISFSDETQDFTLPQ